MMSSSPHDDDSTLLGPAYAIERELTGGGMSRVFLATERQFDRRIVVKVLADALREGLSAERFTREITLAARLQHPNIVPLLAAGLTSNAAPYDTMPYVDGASLRKRLTQGPVPLNTAVALFRSAVASDSSVGEAWAYLAFTESLRANALGSTPEAVARARAAAAKALRMVPDHPLVPKCSAWSRFRSSRR